MPGRESELAETYAEALDLAARRGEAVASEAARVGEELAAFVAAWRQSPSLRLFLEAPTISTEAKQAALRRGLLAASTELVNFLQLLVDRGRVGMVEEIARAFHRRRAEAAGELPARAIVARALAPEEQQRVTEAVARRYGRPRVRLAVEVRPAILGGIILEVGEERMDGSLRNRLERLRQRLAASRASERLWEAEREPEGRSA